MEKDMESFARWDDDLNQKLSLFAKTKRFKNNYFLYFKCFNEELFFKLIQCECLPCRKVNFF